MVWIVSPPYAGDANVTPFVSGVSNPRNVSITKQGTQAYITGSGVTRLLSYPVGTTIATVGSPTYAPTAAVDIYNYVP